MFKHKETSGVQNHDSLAPANVQRRLTVNDVALGMGRKATDAEMEEYLDRPHGKSTPLPEAIAKIKKKLAAGGNRNKV